MSGKSVTEQPSAAFPYESKFCEVEGSNMHYVEAGEGAPILLLHGNPTSSYLWRNVIPELSGLGRCIAPDLIGMGQSDKPDLDYRFVDHARYLEGFIEAMNLENVTLVLHDWGSALGFHYAMRHENNVRGIAFMEGIVRTAKFKEMPSGFKAIFRLFRNRLTGPALIQGMNFFVKKVLPMSVVRPLSDEEMQHYLAPYPSFASRKPLYVWPNEIPFDGKPSDVHDIVNNYRRKLEASPLPKLLLWFKPGALINKHVVAELEGCLPNLQTEYLGSGIHFVQEDQPVAIGQAIASWMREMELA